MKSRTRLHDTLRDLNTSCFFKLISAVNFCENTLVKNGLKRVCFKILYLSTRNVSKIDHFECAFLKYSNAVSSVRNGAVSNSPVNFTKQGQDGCFVGGGYRKNSKSTKGVDLGMIIWVHSLTAVLKMIFFRNAMEISGKKMLPWMAMRFLKKPFVWREISLTSWCNT